MAYLPLTPYMTIQTATGPIDLPPAPRELMGPMPADVTREARMLYEEGAKAAVKEMERLEKGTS